MNTQSTEHRHINNYLRAYFFHCVVAAKTKLQIYNVVVVVVGLTSVFVIIISSTVIRSFWHVKYTYSELSGTSVAFDRTERTLIFTMVLKK